MSDSKSRVEDLPRSQLIKLVLMQSDTIARLEAEIELLQADLKAKNPTQRIEQLKLTISAQRQRPEIARSQQATC